MLLHFDTISEAYWPMSSNLLGVRWFYGQLYLLAIHIKGGMDIKRQDELRICIHARSDGRSFWPWYMGPGVHELHLAGPTREGTEGVNKHETWTYVFLRRAYMLCFVFKNYRLIWVWRGNSQVMFHIISEKYWEQTYSKMKSTLTFIFPLVILVSGLPFIFNQVASSATYCW